MQANDQKKFNLKKQKKNLEAIIHSKQTHN